MLRNAQVSIAQGQRDILAPDNKIIYIVVLKTIMIYRHCLK